MTPPSLRTAQESKKFATTLPSKKLPTPPRPPTTARTRGVEVFHRGPDVLRHKPRLIPELVCHKELKADVGVGLRGREWHAKLAPSIYGAHALAHTGARTHSHNTAHARVGSVRANLVDVGEEAGLRNAENVGQLPHVA